MAVVLILLQDLSIFIENTWEYIKEFDELIIRNIPLFIQFSEYQYTQNIIIIVKTDKRVSFDFVESSGK